MKFSNEMGPGPLLPGSADVDHRRDGAQALHHLAEILAVVQLHGEEAAQRLPLALLQLALDQVAAELLQRPLDLGEQVGAQRGR